MKRKIEEKILEWKNKSNGKTALLIDGARRVGKSFITEEFARKNYKSYIFIDFNKAGDEIKELFDKDLNDLDSLFMLLSAAYNTKLYERESLIVFDEVQLYPRARAAIKFLVADGRYDYMETGSLMSIKKNVENILIPCEELLMPVIKKAFEEKKPVGQVLHRKIITLFREYVIIGGMPQAVDGYLKNGDFEAADAIKRDIISLYREDIQKHAKGYESKVESIFDEIPAQLSKHEKRFTLASLGKGARFRDYESAFLWLQDSMIANICFNSTEPNLGLKLNRDNSSFKIYMGDTGLLISHAFDENGIVSEEIYKKLLFGKLEVNEGMIIENVVAQMLAANGKKLYFYSNPSREDKDSRMEIDFLLAKSKITSRHNISPIEVKSGKNYTLSSLNKFRKKYDEQLHVAYVVHMNDLKEDDGIVYLPVYMTGLL